MNLTTQEKMDVLHALSVAATTYKNFATSEMLDGNLALAAGFRETAERFDALYEFIEASGAEE